MRSMPAPCSEARGGNHSLAVNRMPATGISQTVRANSRLWTGCIGANLLVQVTWSQGPRRGRQEVSNRVLLDLIEFVDKQEPARRRFHPGWHGAYGPVGGFGSRSRSFRCRKPQARGTPRRWQTGPTLRAWLAIRLLL